MPIFPMPRTTRQQQLDRHLATAAVSGSLSEVLRSIAVGADPHQNDGALLARVVQKAVLHRAPRSSSPDGEDPGEADSPAAWRAAEQAAQNRATRWEIVEHLVRVSGLDINRDRAAVLAVPVREGDLHALQRLIGLGADPRLRPGLLGRAVSEQHLGVVRCLAVEHGLRDPRAGSPAQMRQMILAHLGQHEHQRLPGWDRVQELARLAGDLGVPVDAPMATNALMWLAARPAGEAGDVPAPIDDTLRLARWLVERGASLQHGDRALHGPWTTGMILGAAAYSGQRALFDTLVDLGADPRADRGVAIERAAQAQRYDMVRHLMVRHGLSPAMNAAADLLQQHLGKRLTTCLENLDLDRPERLENLDRHRALMIDLEVPVDVTSVGRTVTQTFLRAPDRYPVLEVMERLMPIGTAGADPVTDPAWQRVCGTVLSAGRTDLADGLLALNPRALPNGATVPGVVSAVAIENHAEALEWLQSHGVPVLEEAPTVLPTLVQLESTVPGSTHLTQEWFRVHLERAVLRTALESSVEPPLTAVRPRPRL